MKYLCGLSGFFTQSAPSEQKYVPLLEIKDGKQSPDEIHQTLEELDRIQRKIPSRLTLIAQRVCTPESRSHLAKQLGRTAVGIGGILGSVLMFCQGVNMNTYAAEDNAEAAKNEDTGAALIAAGAILFTVTCFFTYHSYHNYTARCYEIGTFFTTTDILFEHFSPAEISFLVTNGIIEDRRFDISLITPTELFKRIEQKKKEMRVELMAPAGMPEIFLQQKQGSI